MTEQKPRSFIAAGAAAVVSRVIASRARRRDYFNAGLFADAAWDVLLHLFLAQLEGRKVGIANLLGISATPPSTTRRWIEKLEQDGWIRQGADVSFPARRTVELSGCGSRAMQRWLTAWSERLAQIHGDPALDILERIERGRREG